MSHITFLPGELLSNLFNKLDDLNSLAECRLVCRAWSVPAETAMLSTVTLSVVNAAKARSLYRVLKLNPEKARLIKHLGFYDFPKKWIQKVLPLSLTPNVESITGFVSEDGFFDVLTNTLGRYSNRLDRLKTLKLSSFKSEPPLRLALHCRNTIQTIQLKFNSASKGIDWYFVDRLNEFINLTSLELTAKIGTISKLDRILSKCQRLQKLSLVALRWELALDWDQQRIERNTNLEELSIREEECPIEVLEYLLYKYPSIDRASVNVLISRSFDKEYILQVPRLLQRVSQRELIYIISGSSDISIILSCLKNNNCQITIGKPDFLNNVRIKIHY